ncbi:protein containg FOG: LysM repeat [Longilinea arvoryzae]|uniref:Protein containg FOG: LysM repeat n=1 Tax=Longilinea arvoryzae TaxID=360412 RepID=A0A0S7BA60_9CHLR|nr:LysM peptidoglycan-binding domain-containing protein [Longilinea arvoryzae]GAP14463.1 protein containg FOG: LysM repeat [Longilinea arvoryzae]
MNENATRCLVCGRTFQTKETPAAKSSTPSVKSPKLPELTVTLPIALVMILLFVAIGAGAVYGILQGTGKVVEPTITPTASLTPTVTLTATITPTGTMAPSATPLPDVEYTVKQNDTCLSIALAFDVSVNSIILKNNLSTECILSVGTKLLVPQPTPTPAPLPTETLQPAAATESACQTVDYTVTSTDTLGSIAANYNVSAQAIREYNGLPSDVVFEGAILKIPLCQRLPTEGPTPTATNPPPYAAPNLLLPADGAVFMTASDVITLQWAAIGGMLPNEGYAVTVEDLTEGAGRKLVEYVTDTKYIVPANFRPTDALPHAMRWTIVPVRPAGQNREGQALWEPAGAVSISRVFVWMGSGTTSNP